jgi:hypothetical protein
MFIYNCAQFYLYCSVLDHIINYVKKVLFVDLRSHSVQCFKVSYLFHSVCQRDGDGISGLHHCATTVLPLSPLLTLFPCRKIGCTHIFNIAHKNQICYVMYFLEATTRPPPKILTQFIVQIAYINYVNIGYK